MEIGLDKGNLQAMVGISNIQDKSQDRGQATDVSKDIGGSGKHTQQENSREAQSIGR
jgi:hypothetical protein